MQGNQDKVPSTYEVQTAQENKKIPAWDMLCVLHSTDRRN